jgi:predicted double-glycine peptidase
MKFVATWLVLVTVLAGMGALPVQAATLSLSGINGGSYALQVTSLKEARFKTTRQQQFDFSCGSAALATLLTYHYDTPVTEKAVFEAMFASGDQEKIKREGFSLLDIKSYLKTLDFQADGFELPLSKLAESKLPAMVLVVDKGYHHFVVVKGLRDGRILVGDPSSGTRAVSLENFETLWQNKLLFVIHNQQSQAKFNQPADWQVAPRAPLQAMVNHSNPFSATLPKFGPGDF